MRRNFGMCVRPSKDRLCLTRGKTYSCISEFTTVLPIENLPMAREFIRGCNRPPRERGGWVEPLRNPPPAARVMAARVTVTVHLISLHDPCDRFMNPFPIQRASAHVFQD